MQSLSLKEIPAERRIKWFAFFFVFGLTLFEIYKFRLGYSDFLAYLLDSGDLIYQLFAAASLILPFYLLFKLVEFLLTSSWIYKASGFLLFGFALLVEYGYQGALGRFFRPSDLEIALETTSEQKTAALALYLNFSALIPCLALLACFLFIKQKEIKADFVKFVKITGSFVLFFAVCALFSNVFAEKEVPMPSVASFARSLSEITVKGSQNAAGIKQIDDKNSRRRNPAPQPVLPPDFKPKNNVVLVIDESVRGDHLSINGYERQTTPFLENLARGQILHNWKIAASASTGSVFSFNCLLTGITPDELPDPEKTLVYGNPTIFQFAKSMNYTTYYFDGQMETLWGGIPDDKNYIDNWFPVTNFLEKNSKEFWTIDNKIAKKINQIIANSSGNFIVVFKHGSHFPYNFNFSEDQQIWKPSFSANKEIGWISEENIPAAVNSYDNSLRYNIDSFFQNLISDYRKIPNNTVIVYTGDHGQTLFGNGLVRLHGGNSKEEAIVPLFIIGKLTNAPDTDFKASHHNIFPTLLDLFEYPSNLLPNKKSLSLLNAKQSDSRPRYFNPDLGEKVPFD